MSLISTLLSGQKPTLIGFAQVFNVDKYRDKLEPGADELEMSNEEYKRQKAKDAKSNPSLFKNKTKKADERYLNALRGCNLTCKEISAKTGRELSQVQRQVNVLEAKGLIIKVGKIDNGRNPAIVWGLKS